MNKKTAYQLSRFFMSHTWLTLFDLCGDITEIQVGQTWFDNPLSPFVLSSVQYYYQI
jgi:hypothetical protein